MRELEGEFLLAVQRGEMDTLRQLLKTRSLTQLDVNCRDPLDRNALIISIDNRNLETIKLLLETDIQMADALLYAIKENFVEAVEMLLDQSASRAHQQQQQQPQQHHDVAAAAAAAARHHHHGSQQPEADDTLHIEASSGLDGNEYCFFSSDMTPLMLAAQKNNLEIVKLLLDRNVSPICEPHDPRCGCSACCLARSRDCLKHSRARINAYRALSSPSLMALASPDPLETAFRMSAKLEHLAQLEPEYKESYMKMRSKCQAFATKLLDYARTSNELETLLDFNGMSSSLHSESSDFDEEHEVCFVKGGGGGAGRQHSNLARLKLAIECKQKTFCAHPNIQELLASMWYENLPGFRRMSMAQQALQVLAIGLMFPIYSAAYLLVPKTHFGQYIRKPFIKFICHSASYITFITLLVLASQRVEAFYCWPTIIRLFTGGSLRGGGHLRDGANLSLAKQMAPNMATAAATSVEGLDLSRLPALYKRQAPAGERQLDDNDYDQLTGGHNPAVSKARSFDSLSEILSQVPSSAKRRGALPSPIESVILIWVVSLIWAELKQIQSLGINYYRHDMWNLLDSVASSCYIGTIILRIISYVEADEHSGEVARELWNDYDPTLLSEGLFATGTIFSSLKLVYIFSVNPYLGPLQISLGRMIIDILRFSWIYMLVLFAFACGMNQLLWYYADLEHHQCLNITNYTTDSCKMWRHFSNVFESSQTLFWANFGLVDLENFDLTGIKQYTRFWALLMFGCYCFINVIVVLNLLVAMMNHSYDKISFRSDIEWKFARTRLWMSYFDNGSTVPAPFNIIPSIKSMRYLYRRLSNKLRRLQMDSGALSGSGGNSNSSSSNNNNNNNHSNCNTNLQLKAKEATLGRGNELGAKRQFSRRVIKTLVRRYLVDEQRKFEKASKLTEVKLTRWSRLNLFSK